MNGHEPCGDPRERPREIGVLSAVVVIVHGVGGVSEEEDKRSLTARGSGFMYPLLEPLLRDWKILNWCDHQSCVARGRVRLRIHDGGAECCLRVRSCVLGWRLASFRAALSALEQAVREGEVFAQHHRPHAYM